MTDDSNEFTLEVVELENEDGATEEYVILDRIEIGDRIYALMAALSDVEQLQDADNDAWSDRIQEGDMMFVLRVEGEDYFEPDDDEIQAIQDHLTAFFEEEE
ncbi:MAG: DUF1292 domain-containing protein [Acidobacteria bacterium]|nr:DUF1292 domain-containing protein [Acidobacteriota bacterium]